MRKKFNIPVLILLITLISTFSSSVTSIAFTAEPPYRDTTNLVLASSNHVVNLPNHFRKTTDLSAIKDNNKLNLKGLDKLNISGSSQFSESNLPNLIKAIGTSMPITVVDLRQESHGNEKELVMSQGLSYVQIPVKDGGIPTDDMVDHFIELVKSQPENSWLHFHCKAGVGRTTTFMVMYDIVKNHKEVSLDEIIQRQLALGNVKPKNIYNNERINFLKKFYEYCNSNGDSYKIKWSEWKNSPTSSEATAFKSINLLNRTTGYIKIQ